MRQAVVVFLLCALVALWAQALPRHVHATADHPHAEHQHGIASHTHEHEHAPISDDAHEGGAPRGLHVGPCSPDAHTVDAALTSGAVAGDASSPTVAAVPAIRVPEAPGTPAAQTCRTDVRAHGPPAVLRPSPRAPPVLLPA